MTETPRLAVDPHVVASPGGQTAPNRRGTILVFVLGTLTLLLLIGVGLLSTVRGERARWQRLRSAQVEPQLLDQVVQTVRERLRNDLWSPGNDVTAGAGNDPHEQPAYLDEYLGSTVGDGTGGSGYPGTLDVNPAAENNEPYDAPGPADRWLASTLPFVVRDGTSGLVIAVPTGSAGGEQTIAWPRVSYLGSDIIASDVQRIRTVLPPQQTQYWWSMSSRDGNPFLPPVYGDDLNGANGYPPGRGSLNAFAEAASGTSIEGVPLMLTVPTNLASIPGYSPAVEALRHRINGVVINFPGTTTEISISNARRLWDAGFNRPMTGIGTPTPAFPYFDTNMDGIVDLYDADGDGIPDSPLSFAMPYPGRDPNDPSRVYAAIRIIDNASMINVNTASPAVAPETAARLTFDEIARAGYPAQDYQRRGRYPSDVLLNAAILGNDNVADRPSALTHRLYTGQGTPFTVAAGAFSPGFATRYYGRTYAIGGRNPYGPQYEPYDIGDEQSLRNRFLLPPTELAGFNKSGALADYSSIDTALRWTLLWNRQWLAAGTYDATFQHRAGRFSTNTINNPTLPPPEAVGAVSLASELTTIQGPKGWKTLATDDAPWGVRRAMLTTISYASTRRSLPYTPPAPALQALQLDDGAARYLLPPVSAADMREKVSINPVFRNPMTGNVVEPMNGDPIMQPIKARYISLLAHAIYSADVQLGWNNRPPITSLTASEREDVAWQLALNIVDSIDADTVPTVLVDAAGLPRYVGLDVQPFITKVYAELDWDYTQLSGSEFMGSEYAVELINPFPRPAGNVSAGLDVANYKLSISGGAPDVNLNGGAAIIPWYDYQPTVPLPGPGRLVVQSVASVPTVGTSQFGQFLTQTHGTMRLCKEDKDQVDDPNFYSEVELIRRLQLTSGLIDWVVDRCDIDEALGSYAPGSPDYPENPTTNPTSADSLNFCLQRDDWIGAVGLSWQFTVDWYRKERTSTGQMNYPRLGDHVIVGTSSQNTTYGGTAFPGSAWVIRNTGFVGTSAGITLGGIPGLDSIGDLSRILAVGTRNPAAQRPITQIIRENNNPNMNTGLAIGRADFTNENQMGLNSQNARNAANLFHVLTTDALSYDGIDNDGLINAGANVGQLSSGLSPLTNEVDGALDPASPSYAEAQRCHYRVAGMINVNTAPATVLRAVPFMANNGAGAGQKWDFAAAIVSERERRSVPTVMGAPSPAFASAGNLNDPTFKSLGDLINAGKLGMNAGGEFSLRRFANQGVDLVSHDTAANSWSPDFDGKALAAGQVDDNATAIGDVRERDMMLSRWGGILTTRSDVYTVYIALIDENGRFLRRTQFTLDRSVCASEDTDAPSRRPVLPAVLGRVDTDYADDTR